MSDIRINISDFNDSAQNNPTKKQKKKKKWLHSKMQRFKGFPKDGHKYNGYRKDSRPGHTVCQNGALTNCSARPTSTQSVPHLASASDSNPGPSASTSSKSSLRVTVNNNLCKERPKGPVNTFSAATCPGPSASSSHNPTGTSTGIPTKYLAIDCEMVGTGPKGSISQLARCSVVSYNGDVVYDKFIIPPMPVTDYRTRWSGIRRSDLHRATPYSEARKDILRLLKGKVVVGHAIHNDFKALGYSHPTALTRDTSRIPLLNRKAGFGERECASLKRLTKAIFNQDIQVGKKGHSSVEDAKATMELYKVVEEEWEKHLASKPPQ